MRFMTMGASVLKLIKKLAERTGLEPATPGVTGRYSNQLNYRSAVGNGAFYSKTPYRQA